MSKTSLPSPQGVSVAKRAGFELFIFSLLKEEFRVRGKEIGSDFEALQKEETRKEAEEILSTYSWTRLNKLLFFTVMEDELKERTIPTDKPLSSLFDAFTAYPNGPVEAELYEHRKSGFWATLGINEGGGLKFRALSLEDFKKRLDLIGRITEDYKDRIILCLKETLRWTSEHYTGTLSWKSHELCIWDIHKDSIDLASISYKNVSKSLEDLRSGKPLRNGDNLETLLNQFQDIKGPQR